VRGVGGDMVDSGGSEDRRRAAWCGRWTTTRRSRWWGTQEPAFEGTIRLPAGDYVLRYKSDGSHSYDDWNDDAPDIPELGHHGVPLNP